MANRQVRLEPDVVAFVEEHSYDWDCSLSAAVNRLLRSVQHPEPDPPKVAETAPVRVARGTNPRVAAYLRRNAGQQ